MFRCIYTVSDGSILSGNTTCRCIRLLLTEFLWHDSGRNHIGRPVRADGNIFVWNFQVFGTIWRHKHSGQRFPTGARVGDSFSCDILQKKSGFYPKTASRAPIFQLPAVRHRISAFFTAALRFWDFRLQTDIRFV